MEIGHNKCVIVINVKKLNGDELYALIDKLNHIYFFFNDRYEIIIALQVPDAIRCSPICKFQIYIQDIFSEDANSFLNCPTKFHSNVTGVILNHPEKKLTQELLKKSLNKANLLSMKTLICATNVKDAKRMERYKPSYIGIENELLIGKDISILDFCPDIVKTAAFEIRNKILIGAGIKTSLDLKHAINSGASGVLISSLIIKSSNPIIALKELLN